MPRVNPEVLSDVLDKMLTQVGVCYELARNYDLLLELERLRDKIEMVRRTVEEANQNRPLRIRVPR